MEEVSRATHQQTTVNAAMPRQLISSGSSFEELIAYSRAVVQGEWIFVSGTTGFDYATMSISPLPEEQAKQCLVNIDRALRQAGASLADVVRVRYILPNRADFEKCWPVLREYFGAVRPAATMMVADLLDPRMLIEIEVTAVRSGAEVAAGGRFGNRATSSRLPPNRLRSTAAATAACRCASPTAKSCPARRRARPRP